MGNDIHILAVEKQRKKYKVFTNSEDYIFDEDIIVRHMIFKDKVFDEASFKKILKEQVENLSLQKAISYLKYGLRSEWEIKNYLGDIEGWARLRKRLIELSYIDDNRFAESLSDYYIRTNKGPQFIKQKLYEKKVAKEIINKIINKYTTEIEREIIQKIINKEINLNQNKPAKKQIELITSKLIRNGFNYENVKTIINQTNIIDKSDEALVKDYEKLLMKYKSSDFDNYDLQQKIIEALLRKSYDYQKIKKIMKDREIDV